MSLLPLPPQPPQSAPTVTDRRRFEVEGKDEKGKKASPPRFFLKVKPICTRTQIITRKSQIITRKALFLMIS